MNSTWWANAIFMVFWGTPIVVLGTLIYRRSRKSEQSVTGPVVGLIAWLAVFGVIFWAFATGNWSHGP